MPRRDLPTPQEALRILGQKRTRPQRRPPPPLGRALNKTLKALDAKFGQGSGALEAPPCSTLWSLTTTWGPKRASTLFPPANET